MQIKLNKDGQLYCDSNIDLGIFGVYNEIEIDEDLEDMTEEEKRCYLEMLNKKNNLLYQTIQNNMSQITDEFLKFLFGEFYDITFEFWKWIGDKETTCIIEEKMPDIVTIETIYCQIDYSVLHQLSGAEQFRRFLPMIDVWKIIDHIIPGMLTIFESEHNFFYEFEFNSMELGHELLLATLCEFDLNKGFQIIDNRG